jgi:acetolactate synthase-1/2/3 large subunit
MKLAEPDKDIIALSGDGTYVFSCPTAVYWMARKYNTPFMTVIFNNRGWNAPKMITLGEHPDGFASREGTFWTQFDPPAELDKIAEAAGGAFARTVAEPGELKAALLAGRKAVSSGRSAVINVLIDPV